MGNKAYCFPLTITDFTSRYIIGCEALSGTAQDPCYAIFEHAFKEYGLPEAIRSDNGTPFASGNALEPSYTAHLIPSIKSPPQQLISPSCGSTPGPNL
jgi:hypothetical protein